MRRTPCELCGLIKSDPQALCDGCWRSDWNIKNWTWRDLVIIGGLVLIALHYFLG